MNRKNIAIFLSGVQDIRGGGGVERFFSDFFRIYSQHSNSKFELFFFLDESTFKALHEVNKITEYQSNIVLLKNYSNRFKKQLENVDLKRKIRKYKIAVFHCANYGRHDFNRLMFLRAMSNGPKLVQNIVDCQIPYVLADKSTKKYKGYFNRYVTQPNAIQFDGVYSWYELYLKFFSENNFLPNNVIARSISTRFANTEAYKPSDKKEKQVIFASRLNTQKNPDWFVKAVHVLKEKGCNISEWEFLLYGNGELEKEMTTLISELNLNQNITMKKSGDLSDVLSVSTCYVSTQDFENFPSLSMMEAMACGNIILARNVGQTELMVKDGYNGLILKEDSPRGLANAIESVINYAEDTRNEMMRNSLNMIENVHTPIAFINQIETFWEELLAKKKEIL